MLTKPPSEKELAKQSGTRKTLIAEQEMRELTKEESGCVDQFVSAMQQTGSDMTDTYRVLGSFKVLSQEENSSD